MSRKNKGCMSSCSRARAQSRCVEVGIIAAKRRVFFFFKQKTAYEIDMRLEFRRVLFRSTRLQFNNTDAGSFATGARARTGDGSEWTGTVFTDFQSFHSTFSTQAADRNSETLALDQRVPTTAVGAALTWSHVSGAHRVLAGTDFRWIEGETGRASCRERV